MLSSFVSSQTIDVNLSNFNEVKDIIKLFLFWHFSVFHTFYVYYWRCLKQRNTFFSWQFTWHIIYTLSFTILLLASFNLKCCSSIVTHKCFCCIKWMCNIFWSECKLTMLNWARVKIFGGYLKWHEKWTTDINVTVSCLRRRHHEKRELNITTHTQILS